MPFFEERTDPSKAFQALRIGGALFLPRLKGRAWIATDNTRYERVHNFSQFQLFSVDAARVNQEPITSRDENPQ